MTAIVRTHARSCLRLLLVALVLAPFNAALADKDDIYTGLFSNTALKGYDTVAYFTEGKPVKGDKRYATQWKGADWHFASQANLDRFVADPEAYAPQYGGYCAWAVSQGSTASADPTIWAIVDDKLYVNYNRKIGKRWEADTANFIELADGHWPSVLQ